MRINTITYNDINNGPGVRISLWTQGCVIKCLGCHNSELWDFNEGREFTRKDWFEIADATLNSNISGLSILGGEPLSPVNLPVLKLFLNAVRTDLHSGLVGVEWYYEEKSKNPFSFGICNAEVDFSGNHKTIWLYTGFTWENLSDEQKDILKYIDVLVDGPYIAELRNTSLAFRGSSNQRLIDVQKSLKSNKIVLYETD